MTAAVSAVSSAEASSAESALLARIEAILDAVPDPEIPVVSIRELGILRDVRLTASGVEVIITPTYSGCPAVEQIKVDVMGALACHHIRAKVILQLAPAWTTDWITPAARDKLRAYGIAPPHTTRQSDAGQTHVIQFATKNRANYSYRPWKNNRFDSPNDREPVNCPQCGSANTTETSHFGSTACKALYKCLDCMEPFDYFKPY